jgi:hypothetical protein
MEAKKRGKQGEVRVYRGEREREKKGCYARACRINGKHQLPDLF